MRKNEVFIHKTTFWLYLLHFRGYFCFLILPCRFYLTAIRQTMSQNIAAHDLHLCLKLVCKRSILM